MVKRVPKGSRHGGEFAPDNSGKTKTPQGPIKQPVAPHICTDIVWSIIQENKLETKDELIVKCTCGESYSWSNWMDRFDSDPGIKVNSKEESVLGEKIEQVQTMERGERFQESVRKYLETQGKQKAKTNTKIVPVEKIGSSEVIPGTQRIINDFERKEKEEEARNQEIIEARRRRQIEEEEYESQRRSSNHNPGGGARGTF